jgi:hypothetical protein
MGKAFVRTHRAKRPISGAHFLSFLSFLKYCEKWLKTAASEMPIFIKYKNRAHFPQKCSQNTRLFFKWK